MLTAANNAGCSLTFPLPALVECIYFHSTKIPWLGDCILLIQHCLLLCVQKLLDPMLIPAGLRKVWYLITCSQQFEGKPWRHCSTRIILQLEGRVSANFYLSLPPNNQTSGAVQTLLLYRPGSCFFFSLALSSIPALILCLLWRVHCSCKPVLRGTSANAVYSKNTSSDNVCSV